MCGIAGIFQISPQGGKYQQLVEKATQKLYRRGPDSRGHYSHEGVWLGHTRLSIIDTSTAAAQPFTDNSGRYTIIFNGEIYNFRQLRELLIQKGIHFSSNSDTEVLLHWLILFGVNGLDQLQGFFAFAFYDKSSHSILVARDRFGKKPLLWHYAESTLTFASEMKAMAVMEVPRKLDYTSLHLYLQLNYIPAPWTIYQDVHKLMPAHYLLLSGGQMQLKQYYSIPTGDSNIAGNVPSYQQAQKILEQKLEDAVTKRLVADVPLGTFLSGGIDSSIITAIASKHVKNLNTFSIGFRDEPMFDETPYARLVAKMHGTNHTEFSLTTDDLLNCLGDVMDYIDEPFADSSALAVYILSRETRQKVTVALSGDGADEMFAGYNKHMAELKARTGGLMPATLGLLHPLLKHIPQSRNNPLANKIRQMYRFGKAMSLTPAERYWQWASMASAEEASSLLLTPASRELGDQRIEQILKHITPRGQFRQVLTTDMHLVLPNDMLTKVDMMSMANSLEVRVPFLDHDLVDWVFSLPDNYKIDSHQRKKILRDTFRTQLPPELYNRNKQGFEVPLLRWFRKDLKSLITHDLLDDNFIEDQKIFDPLQISLLKKKLFSSNPGDSVARVWGLMVFQHWWKKENLHV